MSKTPEVFVYNTAVNALNIPNERHLYETVARNAPEETLHLLGAFKLPCVQYLLHKLWDRRYVCICADRESATSLYSEVPLGSAIYNNDNANGKDNVDGFNEGNIDHLFVTDPYDLSLQNVEAVVFAQPSSSNVAAVPELCTSMNKVENPKLYFFLSRDTIDDDLREEINEISSQLTEIDFPYKVLKK